MEQPTFEQVQSQIQQHYQSGEYAEALDLATRMTNRFPDQAPLLYYWRICMAARLDDSDQALRLLEDVLDQGTWYGEVLLRRSPSLQPLQGLPAFEQLVMRNLQVQSQDQAQKFPLLTLRSRGECEAGDLPCPLLIALHGNVSTAQASVNFWSPAASAGWLVAVPQSTQAMWKDAYVWDDLEVSRREIQHHLESLQRQYAIDPERIVTGGHSMGAEVAIWLALTAAVEAAGFVAIGPRGPLTDDPESWAPIIEAAQDRGQRGYIIIGEEDTLINQENVETLVQMLNQGGIPTDLEIVPEAQHEYIPEYEEALLRGLEYVVEE